MPIPWILALIAILAAAGMAAGRSRALASAGGDSRGLHSLPRFYGLNVAMMAAAAALLVLVLLSLVQPIVVDGRVGGLLMADVRRTADGLGASVGLGFLSAGQAREAGTGEVIDALRAGGAIGGPEVASSTAILTTAGIVAPPLFESVNFFRQYPAPEFFGTNRSPNFGGGSDPGILPLLWGTLCISFIALLVAVPIGRPAAIYMSEYAGPKVRGVAKPLPEIRAGIPTIVYWLFALVAVGPFLRNDFAPPIGLGNSSSSMMTAGLVMGIVLTPFGSALSDDVINAVPQTMIVVLGAGAAALLDLNPFEAMTTVTVEIVSRLTGDADVASPETLAAFALGLTLFAITLCPNVLALRIVRRCREHYE